MKGFILFVTTILSISYCLRFGYIWTAYGHGGQITGIPFALLMIILAVSYSIVKKETRKKKLFYASLFYFLTLACFSITVEIIRDTVPNNFELLYVEPNGIVNKIFLVFLSIGLIATFLTLSLISHREMLRKEHYGN